MPPKRIHTHIRSRPVLGLGKDTILIDTRTEQERAPLLYTVDCDRIGFPVRFISGGRVGNFFGPFAGLEDARQGFECCYAQGSTRYLKPADFEKQADGLPPFLGAHGTSIAQLLPPLDVIDDRPTYEYACKTCDNRTIWNADDLQAAQEAQQFAPCGCPWSQQEQVGPGEACSVIALLIHDDMEEEDAPTPERCTKMMPVCRTGLLIQQEAARLYGWLLEAHLQQLPTITLDIRRECWKYISDLYDNHLGECGKGMYQSCEKPFEPTALGSYQNPDKSE